MPNPSHNPNHAASFSIWRLNVALLALAGAILVVALAAQSAPAQTLDEKKAAKEAELEGAEEKQGILTSEIDSYNDQIDDLIGQVAALRNREAAVEAELQAALDQLRTEQENLRIARERLDHSIEVLEERLVSIYKSGEPDELSVVLDSEGFDDLVVRYEYLQRIQNQDSDVVSGVRELRDDIRSSVNNVKATRDSIAAKEAELEQTRVEVESRQGELEAARAELDSALGRVKGHVDRLEGDVAEIQDEIEAELRQAAAASGTPTLPAGPIQTGSSGMIWPVNGPLTSPFGPRWGRLHAGIDVAAPGGTPIRAALDGTIAMAQVYGGYGNYTCLDHGGGLSTCYAHQSSFAITSGSVSQGDVIGYVGNTGASFGDHLHFEVRVNGVPTDPLGYL